MRAKVASSLMFSACAEQGSNPSYSSASLSVLRCAGPDQNPGWSPYGHHAAALSGESSLVDITSSLVGGDVDDPRSGLTDASNLLWVACSLFDSRAGADEKDPSIQLEAGEPGELVIGIVAPVGADSQKVRVAVREVLTEFGYETTIHKLSARFSDPRFVSAACVSVKTSSEFDRIKSAIDAGDLLRGNTGLKEILGIVAAGSVAEERHKRRAKLDAETQSASSNEVLADAATQEDGAQASDSPAATRQHSDEDEAPLALDRVAHVIHSLKRPEEAIYLSRVYGGRFLLLSIYAPREERLRTLVHRGMAEPDALALIVRDESVVQDRIPQQARRGTRLVVAASQKGDPRRVLPSGRPVRAAAG